MSYAIDLTGQKFGKLTVVSRAPNTKSTKAAWNCKCDCGGTKVVAASNLKSGRVRSCGCLYYESRKIVAEKLSGENSHFYKHGLSASRINNTYRNMKGRCYNPNDAAYAKYGGRGIKVCDQWVNDFMAFYSWSMEHGYTDELTLDRIDVHGDYCPENCRWTDMTSQQNNRTNNVRISYKGEEHTLSEWSQIIGITKSAIYHRYERGWDVGRMLNDYTPPS